MSDIPKSASVIYLPRNAMDGMQHGGSKRTRQICELLQSSKFILQLGQKQAARSPVLRRVAGAVAHIRASNRAYNWRILFDRRKFSDLANLLDEAKSFIADSRGSVLVIEQVLAHRVLIEAAHHCKFPVVCVPQDIESLGFNVEGNLQTSECLREELRLLNCCSAVFTISREDQWLLANFGITSRYLEFKPSRQYLVNSATIRERRNSAQQQTEALLLGTAAHPPTGAGMRRVIEWYNQHLAYSRLTVAGFGSEVFQPFANDRITVLGAVSDDKLNDLVATSSCAIVHQSTGSGALTRIVEFLCAGIPVVANPHAARSHFDRDGVYVYDTPQELAKLVSSRLPAPLPPMFSEDRVSEFRSVIGELCQ